MSNDATSLAELQAYVRRWLGRTSHKVLLVAASYGLWLVTVALAAVAVVGVKTAAARLTAFLHWGPWTLGLVDKLSVVLAGLLWLTFVVFAEGYYRTGATTGGYPLLLRRTVITGAAVLLLLLLIGLTLAIVGGRPF